MRGVRFDFRNGGKLYAGQRQASIAAEVVEVVG